MIRNNSSLGFNLIVGGKGGKLQLTLNTVYYLSTRWEDVGFPGAGPARGSIACRPSPNSPTGQYCGTSLAIQ